MRKLAGGQESPREHLFRCPIALIGYLPLPQAAALPDAATARVRHPLAGTQASPQPPFSEAAARRFNDASNHKSHSRRIDRAEARKLALNLENLEDRQDLQEAVLTLYHLATVAIEESPMTKLVCSDHGKTHVKDWLPVQPQLQSVQLSTPAQGTPARQPGCSSEKEMPPLNCARLCRDGNRRRGSRTTRRRPQRIQVPVLGRRRR